MFDNPLIFVAALVLLAVLLFFRKKEKSKNESGNQADHSVKSKPSKAKAVQRKEKQQEAESGDAAEISVDDSDESITQEANNFELEDDAWSSAQEVEVSVEQVDDLAEYKVYKQFGYFDQAAKSLASYLSVQDSPPKELAFELCGLYLESGEMSGFVESLEEFGDSFEREELEEIVKMGFEVDANDLALRVFAEDKLGWGVDEIAKNIVPEESIESIPVLEEPVEEIVQSSFKESEKQENQSYEPSTALALVKGFGRISEMNIEEKAAVLSFSTEERAARLVVNQVDYDLAVNLCRRAFAHAKRPANIIMDALKLDFQHRNLDNYAQNLWNLYYYLGQYGKVVKEKMLGWGYVLGSHPLFAELEEISTDYQLREVGIRRGYIEESVSQTKMKMLPLIVEESQSESRGALSETGEVLQEAEAQLMYGQVEEAMSTLEKGVFADPRESQLYSMLFDLYERSEVWDRFEDFSSKIRTQGVELPEEVMVMFSHLTQRMNKGGRTNG